MTGGFAGIHWLAANITRFEVRKNVTAAIDYIESHLHEKLELDTIAEAL